MYAARIHRKSDNAMLIMPIPLDVPKAKIEASIRRRLKEAENLEFIDVVELPEDLADQVRHHMEHHEHTHVVELDLPEPDVTKDGIPWAYWMGTMAMLAVMFMILRHVRREGQ